MKNEEMFNRLVENGLDFLSKAISELKDNQQPKYSVIHFHAAVELFLKARLMHEHWSLVISKKQEPDREKFVKGDFQSASLDEANSRLRKIVQNGLSETELKAFKAVAKHRNKMVHFYHEGHTAKESEELISGIVKEQLNAWYFLHKLLTDKWKDVFSDWNEKIADIDDALRKLHEFLQVVFDNLGPEIDTLKKKGIQFEECPSCWFEAKNYDDKTNVIYESKCLVCGFGEMYLKIECPECGEIVIVGNNRHDTNCSCGKTLAPGDVAEALRDWGAAHIAGKEGDDLWGIGNCSDCDGFQTVAYTENEEWICAGCFGVFESLEFCEWCNEQNTGDMEHSMFDGCNHCDGRGGLIRDD